jgi:large subunit ribosomal protein L25
MSQATLHASLSRDHGSRNSRRLRASGSIPAVVYGGGETTVSLSVDAKAFRAAVSGEQGLNSLITLDAEGKTYLVMAREIQRHPVRGTVSHVDFQVVDPNKPVVTEVPLHLVGDAVEIRHADWEVDQQMFNLEVRARPDQIPTHIDIEISALKVGDSIHIEHIVLPKGVEAVGDPSISVVTTRAGRVALTTVKPAEAVVEAPVADAE